ncbi:ATP-binding protein [Comamonas testosteroni]|uniref:ATP-binding protein n=1 Tax=Comamonas testosteroni TaxID=285 RepID=UPI001E40FC45|nr:ATP-binding protein [Comamonas testosteroni]
MAFITGGASLLVTIATWVFYYIWEQYSPATFEATGDSPGGLEFLWIIVSTVICLFVAGYFGIKLAKKILAPLNSVTEAIRKVASGDLSARAEFGRGSLGEANTLVQNFNDLAKRLQQVTEEQKFWNAAISHELRTPVSILSGRLQGLSDGVFEPTPEHFQKLLSQVNSLAHLIEQLRTVGLADAGHLPLQWSEVSLNEEAQATIQFFAERFASSGHIPVLYGLCGAAWCDPIRIRQALLALFENVHRHANKGLVTIRTRSHGHDGYELAVEDQGPGVPEELAPHIFQAFRHSTRNSSTSSSGLGLAVVDAIARSHGGQAKYERLPSGGSRFVISWRKP